MAGSIGDVSNLTTQQEGVNLHSTTNCGVTTTEMNRSASQHHSNHPARPKRTFRVDAEGVLDSRSLPDDEFDNFWDAIVVAEGLKDRLLAQALLNFSLRPKINVADLPLHGIILLVGPPGTGKTSLARGLASKIAAVFASQDFGFIEVDPHTLTSSGLGKSQRAVLDLLGTTIAEHAIARPLVVLLDEVETLVSDRSKVSLEANPIDVLRATDAALTQLDQLARKHSNILFVATSNFPEAIDNAFLSRADLTVLVDLPSPEACEAVLSKTLEALAGPYPEVGRLVGHHRFGQTAAKCQGLDARQIRKLVASACTYDKQTALDPARLTLEDIAHAIDDAKAQQRTTKKS